MHEPDESPLTSAGPDEFERAIRRSWTRTWSIAASIASVLAVIALVVALQTDHQRSSAATHPIPQGVVAWINKPAPNTYYPHAADVAASPSSNTPARTTAPPCAATNLRTTFGPTGGISGHWSIIVTARNAGHAACALTGGVKVTATQSGLPDVTATRSRVFDTGPPASSVAPGADALLGVDAPRYCDAHPGGDSQLPIYRHLRIDLPGNGGSTAIALPGGVGLGCGLETTAFWTERPPTIEPPDLLDDVKIRLQLPPSVPAGSTFSYVVALSNPTSEPILLTPCPGYLQAATATVDSFIYVKQAYALNCTPIGSLRPGQTARFGMRMTVPPGTPPGRLVVRWAIMGPLPHAISSAIIEITAHSEGHS